MSAVTVYEGTVRHRRVASRAHAFTRRLFLAYLDVDALPGSLDDVPGWSGRRVAAVRYRRRDFLDGGDRPLGDAIRDLVEDRLGRRPAGPVFLLAQLRTFGWLFNPLAVYYCWDATAARLDAIVLEVTNTPWGERQWYVLDARADRRRAVVTKAMHVSPFLPMRVGYDVRWSPPGDGLVLHIDVVRGNASLLSATLRLRRHVLRGHEALTVLARHPLLPLRVSAGIYRRALALVLARVPVYRHPSRRSHEVST